MNNLNEKESHPIHLAYLIGTYPGLTNTFIDQEIATLRQLGEFKIQILSIRFPTSIGQCSPEQKDLSKETIYLVPSDWTEFDYLGFVVANLFFIFTNPQAYFGTLIDLLFHAQPGIKAWMMTLLYFWQGVYASWLLRRVEFDHLHVHFMDRAVLVAMVVSRFLGKTYSFTAHAADIYTHTAFVRQKIDLASFMVTVSHYNKQFLLKNYPGINPDKIHILHPWVDVSQFVPSANRPVFDRLHILSVGRLVEKKGHLDLIDALSRLREKGVDFECRIVGDGPLYPELEERIVRNGLQDSVQLLGGLSRRQVLNLLDGWAGVFALPCVIAKNGDRDGIPVSLAEAMAMELPVVSTDIVGIRELVQPGTGILVPPHDPDALAEALHLIANQNQTESAQMGRRGREVVESEFNLLKGTQELAEFFSQVNSKKTVISQKKVRYVSN